ncbi:hypothetical protein LOTGIDRAFT_175836 [Lottia gigantea]|uniref:Uncharacterized protein n=1 Tax=Lottia gigantea TaxID=225164 RepID=V4BMN1_LOTGI|nr:hypothetical protein LOTGIDRAFT_175836 [Lottia gigantea]ESO90214.1 hypothetical protein LOTGIDRAFT_175836 [Lottia gigantea]
MELVFSFKRAYNLEVILVMVERKCPKGDSWNKARCKQIELHYTEVKCLWRGTEVRKASVFKKDLSAVSGNSIAVLTIGFDIHHLQLDDQHSTVRKGKSSGNLPTRNSTATIGVFWGHGLYDISDLLFTDEEAQMKWNR